MITAYDPPFFPVSEGTDHDDDDDGCANTSPVVGGTFLFCTRSPGHDGPHEGGLDNAMTDGRCRIGAKWDDDRSTDVIPVPHNPWTALFTKTSEATQ